MVLLVVGATFGAAEVDAFVALFVVATSLVLGPAILRVVGACFAKGDHFPPELLSSSHWVLLLPPTLFLDFLVLASEGELLSFFERLRSSKVSRRSK